MTLLLVELYCSKFFNIFKTFLLQVSNPQKPLSIGVTLAELSLQVKMCLRTQ